MPVESVINVCCSCLTDRPSNHLQTYSGGRADKHIYADKLPRLEEKQKTSIKNHVDFPCSSLLPSKPRPNSIHFFLLFFFSFQVLFPPANIFLGLFLRLLCNHLRGVEARGLLTKDNYGGSFLEGRTRAADIFSPR